MTLTWPSLRLVASFTVENRGRLDRRPVKGKIRNLATISSLEFAYSHGAGCSGCRKLPAVGFSVTSITFACSQFVVSSYGFGITKKQQILRQKLKVSSYYRSSFIDE